MIKFHLLRLWFAGHSLQSGGVAVFGRFWLRPVSIQETILR